MTVPLACDRFVVRQDTQTTALACAVLALQAAIRRGSALLSLRLSLVIGSGIEQISDRLIDVLQISVEYQTSQAMHLLLTLLTLLTLAV